MQLSTENIDSAISNKMQSYMYLPPTQIFALEEKIIHLREERQMLKDFKTTTTKEENNKNEITSNTNSDKVLDEFTGIGTIRKCEAINKDVYGFYEDTDYLAGNRPRYIQIEDESVDTTAAIEKYSQMVKLSNVQNKKNIKFIVHQSAINTKKKLLSQCHIVTLTEEDSIQIKELKTSASQNDKHGSASRSIIESLDWKNIEEIINKFRSEKPKKGTNTKSIEVYIDGSSTATTITEEKFKNDILKPKIRAGIPSAYRRQIWQCIMGSNFQYQVNEENYILSLVDPLKKKLKDATYGIVPQKRNEDDYLFESQEKKIRSLYDQKMKTALQDAQYITLYNFIKFLSSRVNELVKKGEVNEETGIATFSLSEICYPIEKKDEEDEIEIIKPIEKNIEEESSSSSDIDIIEDQIKDKQVIEKKEDIIKPISEEDDLLLKDASPLRILLVHLYKTKCITKEELDTECRNIKYSGIKKCMTEINKIHRFAKKRGQYLEILSHNCNMKTSTQILKDIDRTYPNLAFYCDSEIHTRQLYCLLTAFAVYDTKIDYCQGMCFPAALMLYYMPEREAFWNFNKYIGRYGNLYCDNLIGVSYRIRTLDKLLKLVEPKISEYFEKAGINSTAVFATGWFMTCFTNTLQFQIAVRLFDILLNEGEKIIYRAAIALFKLAYYGMEYITVKKSESSDLITYTVKKEKIKALNNVTLLSKEEMAKKLKMYHETENDTKVITSNIYEAMYTKWAQDKHGNISMGVMPFDNTMELMKYITTQIKDGDLFIQQCLEVKFKTVEMNRFYEEAKLEVDEEKRKKEANLLKKKNNKN